MLDVIDLSIEFQDHLVPERVVHHVNLHMEPGEIVGLVGESGSGKSMTSLAIAGLLSRHDMLCIVSRYFPDSFGAWLFPFGRRNPGQGKGVTDDVGCDRFEH